MSWADSYIAALLAGRSVQFRPSGRSMSGRIEHRQLVTVVPIPHDHQFAKGQIVLCKVEGRQYLHLVVGIDKARERVMIANNQGWANGWTPYANVYGLCTKVEP